jgi:CO dehydrogenase/acetyl-CoA synthase beta subunit
LQHELMRLKEERVKIDTEKDIKVIKDIREELRKGKEPIEEGKVEETMEKLEIQEKEIDPKEKLSQEIEEYCLKVAEECKKLKPIMKNTIENLEDAF